MVSPSGKHLARTGSEHVIVEMKGEYALATLREISLMEEGVHRFQIRLRGQPSFLCGFLAHDGTSCVCWCAIA